jgi:hypothetical protein
MPMIIIGYIQNNPIILAKKKEIPIICVTLLATQKPISYFRLSYLLLGITSFRRMKLLERRHYRDVSKKLSHDRGNLFKYLPTSI